MSKTAFVSHIPRRWEGATLAWCGRDLSKVKSWPSKVEFINAEEQMSCKHCLIKYRSAPENKLNWFRVEEIQQKSFHGSQPSDEDVRLCQLAIKVDPARYRNYAARLREEYKQSLRGGQ